MFHKKFIVLFVVSCFASTVSSSPILHKGIKFYCANCKAPTIEDFIQIEEHKSIARSRKRRQVNNVESEKIHFPGPIEGSVQIDAKQPPVHGAQPQTSPTCEPYFMNSIEYQKALASLLAATEQVKKIKEKYFPDSLEDKGFVNTEQISHDKGNGIGDNRTDLQDTYNSQAWSDNNATITKTSQQPSEPKFNGSVEAWPRKPLQKEENGAKTPDETVIVQPDSVTYNGLGDTLLTDTSINQVITEEPKETISEVVVKDDAPKTDSNELNTPETLKNSTEPNINVTHESQTHDVGSKTEENYANTSLKIETDSNSKPETISPKSVETNSETADTAKLNADNVQSNVPEPKLVEKAEGHTLKKELDHAEMSNVSVSTIGSEPVPSVTSSNYNGVGDALKVTENKKTQTISEDSSGTQSTDPTVVPKLNATDERVTKSVDDVKTLVEDHAINSVIDDESKGADISEANIRSDVLKTESNSSILPEVVQERTEQEVKATDEVSSGSLLDGNDWKRGLEEDDVHNPVNKPATVDAPEGGKLDAKFEPKTVDAKSKELADTVETKSEKDSSSVGVSNSPKNIIQSHKPHTKDSDIKNNFRVIGSKNDAREGAKKDRIYFKNPFNDWPYNDFDDFDDSDHFDDESMGEDYKDDFDVLVPNREIHYDVGKIHKFQNDRRHKHNKEDRPHSYGDSTHYHFFDGDDDFDFEKDLGDLFHLDHESNHKIHDDDNGDHRHGKKKMRDEDDTDDDEDYLPDENF